MSIATPELLMLGSSAASATCCLAAPARTGGRERALAVTLVLLMGVLVLGTALWVQYSLAGTAAVLTASLTIRASEAGDRTIDWHRVLGTALMVAFVLLHLHVVDGISAHQHGSTDGAPLVPEHDVLLLRLLQVWAFGYAAWTCMIVRHLKTLTGTVWLRWEHATMALGVLTMAFLMT